ncbi:WYL domain-containing protein [Thalassotalea profundi]|uniref:WYL domain-containing protein n=1 Tax=Thalassotalea profundi TaxID=2036687 RepID=A0ABQ3IGX9_9GAMM|nr:WYL domain-containing protein [Thalassotalea profundi]GHE80190.1 WYL domain-containing protein [Thalassotalea profundi]
MKKPNKKQQQRFEIIETIALWEGVINASVLCHFIGVVPRNAITEIQAYNEFVPVPLEYNYSKKLFITPKDFKPIFISNEWDVYHDHLVRYSHLYRGYLWPDSGIELISNSFNKVEPDVIRTINECIKNKLAFQAKYHSMNHPKGLTRTFHPHAIAFNGIRWHMRAYAEEYGEYRDFNLSRIGRITDHSPSNIDHLNDHNWHSILSLNLDAHPSLSSLQRKLVLNDYGKSSPFSYDIRAAMIKYFVKYYPIAVNSNADPLDKPLFLTNYKELSMFLL